MEEIRTGQFQLDGLTIAEIGVGLNVPKRVMEKRKMMMMISKTVKNTELIWKINTVGFYTIKIKISKKVKLQISHASLSKLYQFFC